MKISNKNKDPLIQDIKKYLHSFDFPLAMFIAKKFKIGISQAEIILKQIEKMRK